MEFPNRSNEVSLPNHEMTDKQEALLFAIRSGMSCEDVVGKLPKKRPGDGEHVVVRQTLDHVKNPFPLSGISDEDIWMVQEVRAAEIAGYPESRHYTICVVIYGEEGVACTDYIFTSNTNANGWMYQ